MNRSKLPVKSLALLSAGVMTLAACGGGSNDDNASGGKAASGVCPRLQGMRGKRVPI